LAPARRIDEITKLDHHDVSTPRIQTLRPLSESGTLEMAAGSEELCGRCKRAYSMTLHAFAFWFNW
jgi:hypothetical protein